MNIKQDILHPLKMKCRDLLITIKGPWNYFLAQEKKIEEELYSEYYSQSCSTEKDNSVIFTCDGHIWHGGLADRLKGIVAVYDWCKRNERSFKINFKCPFNLSDYLSPNAYNWHIDENDIVYNRHSQPSVCLMEPRTCSRPEVKNHKEELLEQWMNDSFSETRKQIHVYTNMNRGDVNFSELFNELFRPSQMLQEHIDIHKKLLGSRYLSVSFRFTTLLGDFVDCTEVVLDETERKSLIDKSVEVVRNLAKDNSDVDRILVTADSSTFLDVLSLEMPEAYIIPGTIGHIDYSNGNDVNLKTFLDFILISGAEKVFLAKSGKMYNSAFARTAAMVQNSPFEIIEY